MFAAPESQQRARFGKDETYLLDRPEIASFYRAMTIKGRRRRECGADRTHVWRRGRRHPARVGGQIQIRNGSDLHSSHQMALLLAWSPRHCRDNAHAARARFRHFRFFSIFRLAITPTSAGSARKAASCSIWPPRCLRLGCHMRHISTLKVLRYPKVDRIAGRLLKREAARQ